jgi:hypothetical protein
MSNNTQCEEVKEPVLMRTCRNCKVEKSLIEGFYKHGKYSAGQCKTCENRERRPINVSMEKTKRREHTRSKGWARFTKDKQEKLTELFGQGVKVKDVAAAYNVTYCSALLWRKLYRGTVDDLVNVPNDNENII